MLIVIAILLFLILAVLAPDLAVLLLQGLVWLVCFALVVGLVVIVLWAVVCLGEAC